MDFESAVQLFLCLRNNRSTIIQLFPVVLELIVRLRCANLLKKKLAMASFGGKICKLAGLYTRSGLTVRGSFANVSQFRMFSSESDDILQLRYLEGDDKGVLCHYEYKSI